MSIVWDARTGLWSLQWLNGGRGHERIAKAARAMQTGESADDFKAFRDAETGIDGWTTHHMPYPSGQVCHSEAGLVGRSHP
jgi:hypothetical protein